MKKKVTMLLFGFIICTGIYAQDVYVNELGEELTQDLDGMWKLKELAFPWDSVPHLLHSFVPFRRTTGVQDTATHKGRLIMDSLATMPKRLEWDATHLYIGDSSYAIIRQYEPKPDYYTFFTVKDRGKTAMDTGAVAPYYVDSAAIWRIDVTRLPTEVGLYRVIIVGSRVKHWAQGVDGKIEHHFSFYYFDCKENLLFK